VYNMGASHIRSLGLKFQAPNSLSPHLAKFQPRALSHTSITLDTIVPLPAAIHDPRPGAHLCLIPSLKACHHLNPGLRAHCCLNPDLGESHCLDPGLRACYRLDPRFGACRCRPLPQAVDTIMLPPSSSSSPRHYHTTSTDLNPGLPQYHT
jgi:hypothetical protein